jgi:hypothetical protein
MRFHNTMRLETFALLLLGVAAAPAQVVPPNALAGTTVSSSSSTDLLLGSSNATLAVPGNSSATVGPLAQPPGPVAARLDPALNPCASQLCWQGPSRIPSAVGTEAPPPTPPALFPNYSDPTPEEGLAMLKAGAQTVGVVTEVPLAAELAVDGAGIALDAYRKRGDTGEMIATVAKDVLETVASSAATDAVKDLVPSGFVGNGAGELGGEAAEKGVDYVFDHAGAQDPSPVTFTAHSSSDAARLESMFDDINRQNEDAALANSNSGASQNDDDSGADSDDGPNLATPWVMTLQQLQGQLAASPGSSASSNQPANSPIPPGWEQCTCPAQHKGMGIYIGGVLYHRPGLQCK